MSRVLVIGQALTDFVFRLDTLPSRGEKYRAETAAIVGGGVAANAAVAIARLGGQPHLLCRLGDDAIGAMTLAALDAEGVDCSHALTAETGRSAFSAVHVDALGERQIVNFRGSGLAEAPRDLAGLGPLDAVLVDTRWPEGARAGLVLARLRGIPGVLDGEPPMPEGLADLASHVIFSETGLAEFAGSPDATGLAQAAQRLPGWVAVTRGASGVDWLAGGVAGHEPGFRVKAVDTLAAGDVWHGAFALALAEGTTEPHAARFANAAAALKCTGFGGRDAAPDRARTEKLMKERQ